MVQRVMHGRARSSNRFISLFILWKTLSNKEIYNPVSGIQEERIDLTGDTTLYRIIVRTDEMDDVIEKYFTETKGGDMVLVNCIAE